ncbi:plasmid replication protein RepC [Brucella pseudogrignonensis]|uniref:plasmid replication protein RepC n=1 Tax=Brucella pseudogrignonensis TaxID=419475 RepID=UPI0022AC48EF|nr:plasmid replication protein RepC [Brucella pseudogrignonensis]
MHIQENVTSTFRGRGASFAQMKFASQKVSPTGTVNRWLVYRHLCIAKATFGINDRCLAVLNALLSFYPENELSARNGLVVFPSNRQLALRAHGMPESTLRRHLASLLDAGLIIRRDSPNGKRYAHKTDAGEIEEAFGFSVAPLLERASEIAKVAEAIVADAKHLKRTRERLTLCRRDCLQLLDTAELLEQGDVHQAYHDQYRAIVDRIPRRATCEQLDAIFNELSVLRGEIANCMNFNDDAEELSVNHAHIGRQHIESEPESLLKTNKENLFDIKKEPVQSSQPGLIPAKARLQNVDVSLDLVLRTCPDIHDYATTPIRSWRELSDACHVVSSFLGIAQSVYREAQLFLGQERTSAIIAWLLQRIAGIQSAGGYLRFLLNKARISDLSVSKLLLMDPVKQMQTTMCR